MDSDSMDSDSDESEVARAVAKEGEGPRKPISRKKRSAKPKSLSFRIKKRWRAWLRAIHRDIGYLAVGLTVVYALSGIAINHLGDWDPNFALETETHQIPLPIPNDEEKATQHVLSSLGIDAEPRDFFFESSDEAGDETGDQANGQLEIFFDEQERTFVVDLQTGVTRETYKSKRFMLRAANWLHYNRGKAAWTYIADGFAGFLLFLALSGLFMIRGRKGLIGRGLVLVILGAAVPILYVHFAGGP